MRSKVVSSILVIPIIFSFGCSQIRQTVTSSTGKGIGLGGLLGAGTGAGLGAIGGHSGTGALIGAGAGTIIGGILGHYMGKQNKELKALEQKSSEVKVEQRNQDTLIRVKDSLLFSTGSAEIKPGAYSTLQEIAQILNKYPDTQVKIIGHADSTGSEQLNQTLSESRARSVESILESSGVDPNRITSKGLGSTMPIATNDTPEGRSANRRVEIIVTPVSSSL